MAGAKDAAEAACLIFDFLVFGAPEDDWPEDDWKEPPMNDDLDLLLARIRDDTPSALLGIEAAMWAQIHRRQRARRFVLGEVGRNGGIAAAALLIGIALGAWRPAPPPKPVNITLLLTEVPPASLLE
jgi:hypothetical protein